MNRNKKKTPGRPKKEFISQKPQTKIQDGPGRPRKDNKQHIATDKVPPTIVSMVANSVDESKKKDFIILILFFLSFVLFIVSLYFTFIREKKTSDLTKSEIAEIVNIETGNIDYSTSNSQGIEKIVTVPVDENAQDVVQPTIQNITPEQQMILDFYQAVNTIDTDTIYKLTDAHLESSNVFKTYYNKRWLSLFSEVILAPKIVVSNIQEKKSINNPDIKNFTYTLEYTIASNQQKFTEERSTVLIKKGDDWRIGKLMCETKGCSTMPFFNPDKYK